MTVSLIAAIAENFVIGAQGDLPWRLPRDLKFFADTTKGHFVIMGRKNYDSIPPRFRPLPERPNIVVTNNKAYKPDPGVDVFHSIESAIEHAKSEGESEVFIIGGGEIYRQSLSLADKMYLTHVEANPDGDTYFPEFNRADWKSNLILEQEANAVHKYAFKTYEYTRIK
ncbi:MAG: dihydrofolate reductase [Salibacteraceae bacterium]